MTDPICPICKNQLIPDPHSGWDCIFCRTEGTEPVTLKSPYINHCWNCGFGIDSRVSVKSLIPNMGYHCGSCGKDLTEWKQQIREPFTELWNRIPCPV